MTIIVYRDGVMASDSLISGGGFRAGTIRKVLRLSGGELIAVAGALQAMYRCLAWAEDGMIGNFASKADDFCALIAYPSGKVARMDHTGSISFYSAPFYAEGAGEEIAIGALAAGATAEGAVEVAIAWHVDCGGPVQVVRLGS